MRTKTTKTVKTEAQKNAEFFAKRETELIAKYPHAVRAPAQSMGELLAG